jgi:GDPmannose 4,6-dehydratase
MNKKVIVTGATGQDGSYMCEYLLKNTDLEVVAAVRRTSQFINSNLKDCLSNPRFRIIHFDLMDPHSISATIKNEQPDYFINFGAQTFVKDSWDMPVLHFSTNAIGTLHILEAIKNHRLTCRFYSAGSSEEFGDVSYSPQDINHPTRARSPYGASKVACRQLTKVYRESYGIYAVHGVLFNHESSRRQDYFVTRKISKGVARIYHAMKNLKAFHPIELGNLDAKRDWSDSRDFVEGVWLMLNQDRPKDYILSSGETHTIREFVEKSFLCVGIDGFWQGSNENEKYHLANYIHENIPNSESCLVKINKEFYRPAEVDLLLGDSSPIRRELGWSPKVSFDELVSSMVKFDIENP